MNINEPITNIKLVELMKNLKQDNKKQSDFFNELSEVKLLCPVNMEVKNKNTKGNETIIGEGSSISIISISDNNNNKYLMAFTDWGELRKWNANKSQQALVFSCDDYKTIMKQNELKYQGIVINPYGENLVITLPMIKNIGKNEQVLTKGENVMIGEPSDYPTEMVKKLTEYFTKNREINKAFLLWMVRGEEGGYLLVIDSKVEPSKLYPKVGNICEKFLKGKLLDIVSANTSFGKGAIENYSPFFEV